jgi:hypothetical protein
LISWHERKNEFMRLIIYFSEYFDAASLERLSLAVYKHHKQCIKAFGSAKLTSNFHKMLHLPHMIKLHGPLPDQSVREAFSANTFVFLFGCAIHFFSMSQETTEINIHVACV